MPRLSPEAEAVCKTLVLADVTQRLDPEGTLSHAGAPPRRWAASAPPMTRVTLRSPSMAGASGLAEPPLDAEMFEVLGELGRGGMGVVLHGRQASLNREVAIKQSVSTEAEHVARFLAEARVNGQLEHANIVPVHLLGRGPDGAPLLAMKLVRGSAWSALLRRPPGERPELSESLRVLLAVSNALSYAHGRGIVHRDVKPENVMVGGFGEVFLVDWGIAARIGGAMGGDEAIPLLQGASGPAGTPLYMAPELALGDEAAQGPRTDVYLLGGCLHEILTGRPPHGGSTLREVMMCALTSAPAVFGPEVPSELVAIRNRAMAADPSQRFASVAELRAAVERYIEHRAAYALVDQGERAAAALEHAVAEFAVAPPDADAPRAALDRDAHEAFDRGREALRHALAAWPDAPGAAAGLQRAARAMLRHASATDDLSLARRVGPELAGEPAAQAELAALEARISARNHEVEALREQARRLDWAAVGRPLGGVFLAGGAAGGAMSVASQVIMALELSHGVALVGWAAITISLGALALVRLRAVPVPDSLVSPRVLGSWAFVALACFGSVVINDVRGLPPFHDANYVMSMIGIGFASMAFQTRRWLLAPAAACIAGSLMMGFLPTRHALVSFGVLWMLVLCSVGVALLRGAELSPPLEGPPPAPPRGADR
jgi:eukaryotic-like serine/threonine-protein kinase